MMNRRKFIQQTSLATAGTFFIPLFLKGWDTMAASHIQNKNRKVVIIQFSGGNDGLNTIVSYQNDNYYRLRPQLAIPKNEVIPLSDEQGLNPALSPLKKFYEEGQLCIVNNVGYPNPDRSHFRSMDIWHTASNSDEYLSTGWIGRFLDTIYTQQTPAHLALEIDDTLSLALKGYQKSGFAAQDLRRLKRTTDAPAVKALVQHHHTHEHKEQVGYLYRTLANTVASADYLFEKSKTGKSIANYPAHRFGKSLQQIARLINGGADTQIYYVSLSGFDTHANQKNQQERNLRIYAEALEAFREDLKSQNQWEDTLVMTFSEFGRRVAENASRGTDHGTANVVFLAGGKLKRTKFVGTAPNLEDLDEGDLKYKIDFRAIYSDILKNWLGVEAKTILNADFNPLGIV